MNAQLTVDDYKVMWVVGAAERLATLGVFYENVPLQLSCEAVDIYTEIDDARDALFNDDNEIIEIFKSIAYSQVENDNDIKKEDMDSMIRLLLDFKNDRTKLVRFALSQQFM